MPQSILILQCWYEGNWFAYRKLIVVYAILLALDQFINIDCCSLSADIVHNGFVEPIRSFIICILWGRAIKMNAATHTNNSISCYHLWIKNVQHRDRRKRNASFFNKLANRIVRLPKLSISNDRFDAFQISALMWARFASLWCGWTILFWLCNKKAKELNDNLYVNWSENTDRHMVISLLKWISIKFFSSLLRLLLDRCFIYPLRRVSFIWWITKWLYSSKAVQSKWNAKCLVCVCKWREIHIMLRSGGINTHTGIVIRSQHYVRSSMKSGTPKKKRKR